MKKIAIAIWLCLAFNSFTLELIAQDEITSEKDKEPFSLKDLPIEFNGFLQSRQGFRLKDDPVHSKSTVMNEFRLQLEAEVWLNWTEIKLRNDFVYDWHQNKYVNGLREANMLFTPWHWMDIKVGRQILTWGKGDMIFINDLFPKDWQSFFIGRDIEYLKAPSDAIKLSLYVKSFEINLIYVPQFNSDIYPDNTYLSYFNPFRQEFVGNTNPDAFDEPNDFFNQDEFHWRIRKNIKGLDLSFYGNYGFWKSPAGFNAYTGELTFPSLIQHGLSIEASLAGGVMAFEAGHFHSSDDSAGDNPLIRNGQFVYLISYNYNFKNDFSLGLQYYAEDMLKYNQFQAGFPTGTPLPAHWHDFITLRLTKLLNKQKWELSSFIYYSVSDTDFYWRFNSHYKLNDFWKIDIGFNLFGGKDDFTFWNQFNRNNNLYLGIKRSF